MLKRAMPYRHQIMNLSPNTHKMARTEKPFNAIPCMHIMMSYIDHAITYLLVVVVLRPLLYRVLFAARFTSGRVWYRIRLAISTASGSFQYRLLLDAKMEAELCSYLFLLAARFSSGSR